MAENEDIAVPPKTQNRRGVTRVYQDADILPNRGDILNNKELQSFFDSFAPKKENLKEGENPHAVLLEDIKEIWREQGLLHPKELTLALLERRLPENEPLPAEATALLREVIAAGYQPESLTNSYDSKTATPLITALSHLYALTVAQEEGHKTPVVMIEGDFGNMGGTNQHFANLLGKSSDSTQGWDRTDSAARIVANIALKKLEELAESVEPAGTVMAVRSGGDEVRYIVTGVQEDVVKDYIAYNINPAIDEFTALAGLHDHIHLKHEGEKYREGFSLSFGTSCLNQQGIDSYALTDLAEKEIKMAKDREGYLRKGEISSQYASALQEYTSREDIQAEISETFAEAGYGDDNHALLALQDAIVDDAKWYADSKGKHYASQKPSSEENISNEDNIAAFDDAKELYSAYHPEASAICSLFNAIPTSIERTPFTTEYDYLPEIIDAHLHDKHITLTPNQRELFTEAGEVYRAKDPVTHTLTDRDLARHTASYAQDASELAEASPDAMPARAVHVEFTNIRGFNDNISHEHANHILEKEANILKETLNEHHLKEDAVYHVGGGKFVVLMPSVDAQNVPVTQDKVDVCMEEISKKLQELNKQSLAEFYQDSPALANSLKDYTGKTIGDVQHSCGHSKGIDVVCTGRVLTEEYGGAQIYALRQEAEKMMQEKRSTALSQEPAEQAKDVSESEKSWVERVGQKVGKGQAIDIKPKTMHSFADMVEKNHHSSREHPKGFGTQL